MNGELAGQVNPSNYEAIQSILPTLYIARDKGMAFIQEQQLHSPVDYPIVHLIEFPELKNFHRQQIVERIELIRGLKQEKPVIAIQIIRGVYDKYLNADDRKTLTMHKDIILETLSEIEASAKNHHSVNEFVNFIDSINEKLNQMKNLKDQNNKNEVNVMSIHKSKGL